MTLMCQRIVRVKNCVNGFVRKVSNIDVHPFQRLCETDV